MQFKMCSSQDQWGQSRLIFIILSAASKSHGNRLAVDAAGFFGCQEGNHLGHFFGSHRAARLRLQPKSQPSETGLKGTEG